MNAQIILQEAGFARALRLLAKRYGARVVSAGRSKHPKLIGTGAEGQAVKMTVPSSPSDNARTLKNLEAQMRRSGLTLQTRKLKPSGTQSATTAAQPPQGRVTADQQTTFKQFTQRFQPNVQGPRKPNSPVKRPPMQGPESELSYRMGQAYDKKVDAVLKSIRDSKPTSPASVRSMPKPLTDAEMEKLRRLNLTPRQKKKFREMGLLPEGYKGQRKDDALYARYKDLQDPKDPTEQRIKDALRGIKLKGV